MEQEMITKRSDYKVLASASHHILGIVAVHKYKMNHHSWSYPWDLYFPLNSMIICLEDTAFCINV